MMGKLAGAVYNSFLWATAAVFLCARSVVICMHINMGVLFFACWTVFGILALTAACRFQIHMGAGFSLLSLLLSAGAVCFVYHFVYGRELLSRAGFIMQLALHGRRISHIQANIILSMLTAGGYFCVWLTDRHAANRTES